MKRDASFRNDSVPVSHPSNFLQNALEVFGDIPSLIVTSGINTDSAIDESLGRVGALISASRVYVMLDEKDGCYLRNTHEWVNQEVGPAMFSWPLYDYEYDLPSLKSIIDEKEVFFSHTKDLPKDINHVLTKQNVKSVLLVPLYRDGNRIGLIGCDFCEAEHPYRPEYAEILRYLSGLVSLALERKQYQLVRNKLNTIRKTVADVESLLVTQEVEEAPASRPPRPVSLLDAERRIIIETLELYNGNKLKTAKHLGLTWPSLDRRCKKMGIEVRKR